MKPTTPLAENHITISRTSVLLDKMGFVVGSFDIIKSLF